MFARMERARNAGAGIPNPSPPHPEAAKAAREKVSGKAPIGSFTKLMGVAQLDRAAEF